MTPTPTPQAIKAAQTKANDAYWIRDADAGAFWDREVKRLQALADAGELYECEF